MSTDDSEVRREIQFALRGLREAFETPPDSDRGQRLEALAAGRLHEDRLRRLVDEAGLSEPLKLDVEARLLWCRLHLMALASLDDGPSDPARTRESQTGGLNALAGLAVAICAADHGGPTPWRRPTRRVVRGRRRTR
jgi:hypothetical protein